MSTRTISATEAKNRLGSYLQAASKNGETVVIESRHEPTAVLISFTEYLQLRRAQEDLAEKEFLERFDRILAGQAERNSDLTPEAAEELASRAVRESRARRRDFAEAQ